MLQDEHSGLQVETDGRRIALWRVPEPANRQVDQAIFHDLRYRLLVLLRQIAVIHGRIEKEVAIVDLDVTQGMLAQMLGASREAVNKQLRALAREGGLVMDGHRSA